MLKAIHAQESKKAAREKAKAVVEELRSMKLKEAAKKVEDGIEETLTYCDFPSEHWTRIRTNKEHSLSVSDRHMKTKRVRLNFLMGLRYTDCEEIDALGRL